MSGILNVLLAGKAPSGPASYTGIVATRGTWPSQHFTGAHAANVRSAHYARTDITQLQIICPNVYASEVAPGATMSVNASVEYPAGVTTGQQILFSGSATGTIADGGMLLSDTLTIAIPNGNLFWIRLFLQNSTGIVGIFNAYADLSSVAILGDAVDDTSGVTDQTMTGAVIPNTENVVGYHPIIIGPTTVPSVMIIGDSIASGLGDKAEADASGDWGEIARSIGPKFGYFNAGLGGEMAADFIAHHTQRTSILTYCTHAIVEYGVNDMFNDSATAATVESRLTTIYGYCTGKTVFQTTMPPRTDSTDGWTTAGGQTVLSSSGGYETHRLALNADLRSTFGPAGGVFDTAPAVEFTGGVWKANKTIDGVHPNNSGYLDIKASGAVNTSLIGTVTPPADTGSGWGDKGTFVTLSNTRRSNDTATSAGGSITTVRGASGLSSGLKYVEIEVPISQSAVSVGLIDGTTATGSGLDSYIGAINNSIGIESTGSLYNFTSGFGGTGSGGTFLNPPIGATVYRLAVDFTNGFAYYAVNNVWLNSGVPTSGSSGTGAFASWTPGGKTLYPGYAFPSVAISSVRLRTVSFLYALPSGYSAWG